MFKRLLRSAPVRAQQNRRVDVPADCARGVHPL